MHSGSIKTVLLVHGYSVRTLNSWGRLPQLLQASGLAPTSIFLSDFVTLDDRVSCDDLAIALDVKVNKLGLDWGSTAVIAHSTGAILTRRWLLNRRSGAEPLPSHFISCAGANHGSTLAQLGITELSHIFRQLTEGSSVGQRVLQDLDYGSLFLRMLNRDWLTAWNNANAPLWRDVYCFSMGGTDHSYWQNQLAWQSHEAGSDGTVRISSANLNYRFIDLTPPYQNFTITETAQLCPHLVVETPAKKYSHTSQSEPDTAGLVLSAAADAVNVIQHGLGGPPVQVSAVEYGILEGIQSADERPYAALEQAFAVQTDAAYINLAMEWAHETAIWSAANPREANATVIIAISDQRRQLVDDSLVLLGDQNGTISGVSSSILPHQPIRNGISPSVISLYINAAQFLQVHPHRIHLEARTDTPFITYDLMIDAPISGTQGDIESHVLAANEFTYIEVQVIRDPSNAFSFVAQSDPRLPGILNQDFPPLFLD
ncbi:MAG: hypothetical protein WA215_06010 [Candidatus Cybelea sp.]